MPDLTVSFIRAALHNEVWHLGNQVLYDLCRDHPNHIADDVILAKVWLIGRSYAAAIERRRKYLNVSNDDFYEKHVASRFKSSALDAWLQELRNDSSLNRNLTLGIHKKFCRLLKCITGLDKRSFASKYLHFHCPHRFFIYDSRAVSSLGDLRRYLSIRKKQVATDGSTDLHYGAFFEKCEELRQFLLDRELTAKVLSPREFDKILLAWFAANPHLARPRNADA